MLEDNKLVENESDLNTKFEFDRKMQKIREELAKKFNDYRNTLNYMAADAPISILCLPTAIENCLLDHGCLRIYDLFDLDFTEVKGLGASRIRNLTTSLDKFFSML